MPDAGFKKTLVAAMGWSFAMKAGFQAVSWVMTLAVIRVLSPDDYGLMAIAQVFTNFMLGFANLGLGDALVQRKEVSAETRAKVFGALLAISAVLTVALALAAYPIAAWYGDPRLVPLIQVSSSGFLFSALTTLPRAELSRRMQVRSIFVAELSAGLFGSVVVIALAFAGQGVWALMLGWLASGLVKQVAFAAVAPDAYVWPRLGLDAVRPMMAYGAYSTLEYTMWMLMTSADVLIVGRLLGPAALGLYTVVLNFAALPLTKVAPIVNSVAFPAFALFQDSPAEAGQYLQKAIRLMSLLTAPVFLGIAATAPEVVAIVFGDAWVAARPLLPILSLALTFRAMLIIVPNFLLGMGDAKAAFWCTATGAAILPAAVLVGCRFGIIGACYAWLLAYPVIFLLVGVIASRRSAASFAGLVTAPVRPLLAGALMAGAVILTRTVLPDALPVLARLGALALVGAAVYAAVVLVGFPRLAAELLGILKDRRLPA